MAEFREVDPYERYFVDDTAPTVVRAESGRLMCTCATAEDAQHVLTALNTKVAFARVARDMHWAEHGEGCGVKRSCPSNNTD